MDASPASLLRLPPPRRKMIRRENAPEGVCFALAGRDAQFGAFFALRSYSQEYFMSLYF
jgi:hypothetical protein